MTKERDYFFDNVKAVLMFLVVLGHLLLPIHGESFLVVVKRLIYVFHMPLFVFVSGYFAKTFYKNGRYNYRKLLYLGKAYLVFVVAIQLVYAISGYQAFSQINFFSQSGAPLVSVCNDRMVPYDPGSTRTMSGACSGTVAGAGAWSWILSGNRGFFVPVTDHGIRAVFLSWILYGA